LSSEKSAFKLVKTKDARFRKGHIVANEDIPVLLSMSKDNLYVWQETTGMLHEDDAAQRLIALCQSPLMKKSQAKEGKLELFAEADGIFTVDVARLNAVNSKVAQG